MARINEYRQGQLSQLIFQILEDHSSGLNCSEITKECIKYGLRSTKVSEENMVYQMLHKMVNEGTLQKDKNHRFQLKPKSVTEPTTSINPVVTKSKVDMESSATLDRLLMMISGDKGKTLAHRFMHECGVSPIRNLCGPNFDGSSRDIYRIRCNADCEVRVFIPPKNEDRVVMFTDNSGAYIHSDGLTTFLDSDISNEVSRYQEIAK